MASQETMSSSFSCLVAWLLLLLLLPPLLPPLFAAVDDGMRSGGGSGSNCTTSCGNVGFEYPFGVEDGCYRAGCFNLTCNYSYQPPRLFLGDGGGVQVLDISVPRGWALINNTRMVFNRTWDQLVVGGPYSLSGSNKITLVGCNAWVDLRTQVKVKHGGGGGGGDDTSSNLISSCTAVCPLNLKDMAPVFALGSGGTDSASSAACSGLGCCQANINLDISSSYTIQVQNLQQPGRSISPRDLVFISKEEFSYTYDMAFGNNIPEALPALLDWYISSNPSECTYASAPNYCLSANSFCQAYDLGYKCHCSDGYQGNPYIRGGCLDIDECKSPQDYSCYGNCNNTPGSHICECPRGYEGNASTPHGCKDIDECGHRETYQCYGECINFRLCYHGTDGDPRKEGGCLPVKHYLSARDLGLRIGIGVGGGTILLLIAVGAPFLSRKMKVHKLKRMRQTFFNQNHGLLLQRLISQNMDISERMILSLPVLEKATNNFDSNREVGGGGHGVVYKRILNLDVAAIKKSRIIVEREINDFINEVAIISQINHRNVVKLIGCCLETEVPLLVYEFISNGSLDQHLHVDEHISLSWKDRMRIAVEVARALTYLHSAATIPVFHRDIKACNILLDDHLIAKVSDFGASRYVPINQTEVTTAVQGTLGYLDPEYYYTGHLTDKSDVFSFGVLIIELLTRKRPTYRTDKGDSLVLHFASLVRQGQLVEILDPQVLIEGGGEVLEVALLAGMCTRMTGQDRPTMREVELGLENLQVSKKLVSHDTASSSHDVSQIQIAEHRMLAIGDTEESSIQYSMEE